MFNNSFIGFAKRIAAIAMSAAVAFSSVPASGLVTTYAAESYCYVLMNIPYEDFYANEISDGTDEVDAVASATTSKCYMFSGTYHQFVDTDNDGETDTTYIKGITYPVKVSVSDLATIEALDSAVSITSGSTLTYTTSNHGNTSTSTLEGEDCLMEYDDYSYYVLDEEPSVYKVLDIDSDGDITFSEATSTVTVTSGSSTTTSATTASVSTSTS
ncbi:MAG: hypothetical protein K5840_07145, partial [Eubacterium sp.]|nr:hypothetical protein [Eubacterium sp.]